MIRLFTPFDNNILKTLKAGDRVLISGKLYTARDAGHKRLCELIENGEELPVDLRGQVIYYVGPCIRNGEVLSAGPTTSMRMDAYAPKLYAYGVAASIGKGDRSEEVYRAIVKNGGVYLAAIGGAGALYASKIKSAGVIAFDDLGTEALRELEVENFPCIVAIDCEGKSVYR